MRCRTVVLGATVLLGIMVPLGILCDRADATSGEYVDVTCPVCANTFEAWEWHSTNTFGGVDMDGCRHAAGNQVFLRICWTCPRCLYTGLQSDWKEGHDADLVARLKAENPLKPLATVDPETARTTRIPAGVRWDLYLQILDLQETDAEEKAYALCQTAWTHRFGQLWPEGLDDALSALGRTYRTALREAKPEAHDAWLEEVETARALRKDAEDSSLPLSVFERQHRLLLAAALFKHRGEDPDAAAILTALRAQGEDLDEDVVAGIEELEGRIAWERGYLSRAVPLLREAAASESVEDDVRPWMLLRLAELQRKVGVPEEALATYARVLAFDLPPAALEQIEARVELTRAQVRAGADGGAGEEAEDAESVKDAKDAEDAEDGEDGGGD